MATITIEQRDRRKNGRKKYQRHVYNARPTGHIAENWVNHEFKQWEGTIKFYGELLKVWGYTETWTDSPPLEWADDTY